MVKKKKEEEERNDSSPSDLFNLTHLFLVCIFFPPESSEKRSSFDMHALIRLTPVPHLPQQSHKSKQIGEPELDGGH